MIRRFLLNRTEDETGISGVGYVAEGVRFSDGTCVLRWRAPWPSTVIRNSIKDIEAVHGHGGSTKIEWIDE